MRLPILSVVLFALATPTWSASQAADCSVIDNDRERLRCYDAAHGRVAPARAGPISRPRETPDTSIWEQRILDDARRETFTLTAYRPSYILYTHARAPNQAPHRAAGLADPLRRNEIKLHLSVHTKVTDNLFGNNGDLWLAYAQTSYWQAFNGAMSSPFRETNHEPEAYLSFLTDHRLGRLALRNVNVGLVHHSNGQSGAFSRSWNRVFAEFQLVGGSFGLGIKPWLRIKEKAANDDNPDIVDFMGRYEIRASYEHRRHLFSVMARNVLDRHGRYNAELSWSYPIAGRLRGLVQWYSGYGESLIDYNHRQNRIGFGVLMSDWL